MKFLVSFLLIASPLFAQSWGDDDIQRETSLYTTTFNGHVKNEAAIVSITMSALVEIARFGSDTETLKTMGFAIPNVFLQIDGRQYNSQSVQSIAATIGPDKKSLTKKLTIRIKMKTEEGLLNLDLDYKGEWTFAISRVGERTMSGKLTAAEIYYPMSAALDRYLSPIDDLYDTFGREISKTIKKPIAKACNALKL